MNNIVNLINLTSDITNEIENCHRLSERNFNKSHVMTRKKKKNIKNLLNVIFVKKCIIKKIK